MFCTSAYTDLSRYVYPSGEKYMPFYYGRGQMDFSYPYLGARAWLAGFDPYVNDAPQFTHRQFKPVDVDGVPYKQLYPPGHLLSLMPLALVYGADAARAGVAFYWISLASLLGLGAASWWLLRRVRGEDVSPLFVFAAVTVLAFHPGSQLGLERGQSDVVVALLCWAAVLLMLRPSIVAALFLATWAVSFKGYPAVFLAGLVAFTARPGVWKRALLGLLAGLAVFVAPGARFLGEALKGTLHRSNMFETAYYNHGFKNVAYHVLGARAADGGRAALALLALGVAGLWGWRGWQHRRGLGTQRGALALSMFATASLLAMVGVSALSVSYDLLLVLPGALVLAAAQDRVADLVGLGRPGRHALGAALAFSGFALCLDRWDRTFPIAGLGVVGLVGVLGALGARMPGPTALVTPAAADPGPSSSPA